MPPIRQLAAALTAILIAVLLLPAATAQAAPDADSAHAFSFTSIEGKPLDLQRFAGQPVLLVNTASRCGYTDQYADLQTLWSRYKDRGLVVLAVPSNDFRQELSSEEEVKAFCEATFGVAFPMTEISHVKGAQAHPLYRWLAAQMGDSGRPGWNFHKILIAPDGRPVAGWPSRVRPTSGDIVTEIERLLPAG